MKCVWWGKGDMSSQFLWELWKWPLLSLRLSSWFPCRTKESPSRTLQESSLYHSASYFTLKYHVDKPMMHCLWLYKIIFFYNSPEKRKKSKTSWPAVRCTPHNLPRCSRPIHSRARICWETGHPPFFFSFQMEKVNHFLLTKPLWSGKKDVFSLLTESLEEMGRAVQ